MTRESVERDLDEAVQAFGNAWARGDYETLKSMLSPSYTHTDVKERFRDRDDWLEHAKGRSGVMNQLDFVHVTTRLVEVIASVVR